MTTQQQTFDRLDRLSRERALTDTESLLLERAMEGLDVAKAGNRVVGWTQDIEDRFADMIADGWSIGRAAVEVGKSRHAGIAKWSRIRARYGRQAA